MLDLDLSAMKPDFYSGLDAQVALRSQGEGLLFVNKAVQDRIHPSVDRRLWRRGRHLAHVRDARPARRRVGRGGRRRAEVPGVDRPRRRSRQRVRELARALMEGLAKLPGVKLWTDPSPVAQRRHRDLPAGLARRPQARSGADRRPRSSARRAAATTIPASALAPHFYNTMDEIDRTIGAFRKYLAQGV